MSKLHLLVNVRVMCDVPYYVTRYITSPKHVEQRLEEWVSEINEFMRDHRSQDPVLLSIERQYQDQCSFCGYTWEEDAEGPVCCEKAQTEWNEQKKVEAAS